MKRGFIMPYIKQSKTDYYKFQVLINGTMFVQNKPYSKLSKAMGISENTLRKFINDPGIMPLYMFRKLRLNLNIPLNEWKDAIDPFFYSQ